MCGAFNLRNRRLRYEVKKYDVLCHLKLAEFCHLTETVV